jgi:uncharacterized protein (DUF1697 family)
VALVVLLRGVNVGGHRTFRPSVLAREFSRFEVVNIGAAGTLVVRKPGSRAKFQEALRRKLPFETSMMLCEGREVIRIKESQPFGKKPASPGVVRFVTVLARASRGGPAVPLALPEKGPWLVRLVGTEGRFVFGEYRRHMKTIGYLSQLDRLFGTAGTTRNWNTIEAIVRVLQGEG